MKLLAILSAKKLITLSAVGVLSLATAGGVILNNSNEEPQAVQSSVTFDGEVKESPTAEIVEVEKVEEVGNIEHTKVVAVKPAEPPKPVVIEEGEFFNTFYFKVRESYQDKAPNTKTSVYNAIHRTYMHDSSKFTIENVDNIVSLCTAQANEHNEKELFMVKCDI